MDVVKALSLLFIAQKLLKAVEKAFDCRIVSTA